MKRLLFWGAILIVLVLLAVINAGLITNKLSGSLAGLCIGLCVFCITIVTDKSVDRKLDKMWSDHYDLTDQSELGFLEADIDELISAVEQNDGELIVDARGCIRDLVVDLQLARRAKRS